ncbi:MAG: rhomboid family intramembrane serine protease [Lachnospiraceae bacterium]|nr:rhomboid family intramembrane serine protease [Lachnospiraceae bacterium]
MKIKNMKVTLNAPVVLGIVGISFLATLLGYITGGTISDMFFSTYRSELLSPLTWIRAFAHIFGHSDWTHFVGNMSYLLLLGPMLEEKYGSKTLAGVVAVTAFSTSLVNYILFPNVMLCGASGVVFAFILLSSFTSFKQGEIPLTFILVAIFFIGQQILEGVFVRDNISNLSHIVGGIIGGFLGYEFNVKMKK